MSKIKRDPKSQNLRPDQILGIDAGSHVVSKIKRDPKSQNLRPDQILGTFFFFYTPLINSLKPSPPFFFLMCGKIFNIFKK